MRREIWKICWQYLVKFVGYWGVCGGEDNYLSPPLGEGSSVHIDGEFIVFGPMEVFSDIVWWLFCVSLI